MAVASNPTVTSVDTVHRCAGKRIAESVTSYKPW